MKKIRIGIVGMGAAGIALGQAMAEGKVTGAELAAICDRAEQTQMFCDTHSLRVTCYEEYEEMLSVGGCDAVVIATPHRFHPLQAEAALEKNIHVFSEKPAGIDSAPVRRALEVAQKRGLVYGINFCRRTLPIFRRLHALVSEGAIGELRRINWTATNWLRCQSYFDASPWRGTWAGEGGGLLLNQCPHMLDMWQWVCGMPQRMRAYAAIGKYHDIEVEDEVTAYAEYANGATAVFIGSTGEYPGTSRIEIVGDRGRIVMENETITVNQTEESIQSFIETAPAGFGTPQITSTTETPTGDSDVISDTFQNFVDAVAGRAELWVSASEGLSSLSLGNAMLLSTWTDTWVDLPIDENLYAEYLYTEIANSKPKKVTEHTTLNLADSLRV